MTDVKRRFEEMTGPDDPIAHWVKAVDTPNEEKDLQIELFKRSPFYCISKINTPLLVFQGKIDKSLPYTHTLDFIDALEKNNKEHEFITFENLGHNFEFEDMSKDLETENKTMVKVIEWFDKYLK